MIYPIISIGKNDELRYQSRYQLSWKFEIEIEMEIRD